MTRASIDIAAEVAARPEMDFDPFQKYGGVGPSADLSKGYLVVLQHPVTTETRNREHLETTLRVVASFGLPTIWFWPNPDAGTGEMSDSLRHMREKHPEFIITRAVKGMLPKSWSTDRSLIR